jgi:hypothetical protein
LLPTASEHKGAGIDCVRLLVNKGALVNQKGGVYTALHATAFSGNHDSVEEFLSHGAKVNVFGALYGCAIQSVTWANQMGIMEMLFDHDSDLDVLGGKCGCALQAVALRVDMHVAEKLLDL